MVFSNNGKLLLELLEGLTGKIGKVTGKYAK